MKFDLCEFGFKFGDNNAKPTINYYGVTTYMGLRLMSRDKIA